MLVDYKHETGGVWVEGIIILEPNDFQRDLATSVTFVWILVVTGYLGVLSSTRLSVD